MAMNLYSITMTLILVMDPLGNIPIFLSILHKFDPRRQQQIILRECGIAFLVLLLFLFAGKHILQGLSITTPALSIAGGIILFIIAIKMIFPPEKQTFSSDDLLAEPLVVPLAVPLTAGPSAIATLLLFANRDPNHWTLLLLAVIIACVVFTLIMLSSRYLMKLLGNRGLIAIERLMGMILTTISVQMFLMGLLQYLHQSAV